MSARDHLGRQWMQPEITAPVYRGLHNVTPRTLDKTNLGMHWTVDLSTAKNFSAYDNFKEHDDRDHNAPRTVIHGEAPISSTETHSDTLSQHFVNPKDFPEEKEIPLSLHSPVTVTKMITSTKRKNNKIRERTRTYNPPREMKA